MVVHDTVRSKREIFPVIEGVNTRTETPHMFDGRQTYNQPQFKTLCGRRFPVEEIVWIDSGVSVCNSCIRVELALLEDWGF